MIAPERSHCPACGAALVERELEGEGVIPYCPACAQYRFPQYNVAVSMVVRCEATGRLLLIQQYGRKSNILVAGYVNRGEAVEHAVARELREETGLVPTRLRFNRTAFFEPSNTLMCNFIAFVPAEEAVCPNREIDAYGWFTPEEARAAIRPGSLAERFLLSYLDEAEDKVAR